MQKPWIFGIVMLAVGTIVGLNIGYRIKPTNRPEQPVAAAPTVERAQAAPAPAPAVAPEAVPAADAQTVAAAAAALKQDPLWPEIQKIASHFVCACGQCGEMLLEECECGTPRGGLEEKLFIRDHLVAGLPDDEIIEHVEKQYGGRIADAGGENPVAID